MTATKKELSIIGYHLGARLDIRALKNSLTFNCVYFDPTEIIFSEDGLSFIQIHDYGSVVFFGIEKTQQNEIIGSLRNILKLESRELKAEHYDVEIDADSSYKVHFDRIVIDRLNLEVARVLMLNIAQSVALDNYTEQANQMLEEISIHTAELEKEGKFQIKGKNLTKYIGKTMNLKNIIATNLYIFDSPNIAWNDEYLNQINLDLVRELDIASRYRNLQESVQTIKESLEIFNDFHQHAHSAKLEWIIIFLILFEIVKSIVDSLIK